MTPGKVFFILAAAAAAPLLSACDVPAATSTETASAWAQTGSCTKSTLTTLVDDTPKTSLFSCSKVTVRMRVDQTGPEAVYKEGKVTFDTTKGSLDLFFPEATWTGDAFSMDLYHFDAPDLTDAISSGGQGKCSGLWDKKQITMQCYIETGIETLHVDFAPAKGLKYASS